MRTHPRWRVVVLDDHERSRVELRAAIEAAGGAVAAESGRGVGAEALVRAARPDAAICAIGLADGDGLAAAAAVTAAGCPVVLLTSHVADDLVARARAAGVMAYLVKPLRAAELAPTLDLAVARFREARSLARRLEERKLIERAKGTLMTRYGLSEGEAFRRLRRAAMDSRRPMAEVARALLVSESIIGDVPAD